MMVAESTAIIVIILLMFGIFLRKGKTGMALAVLPLAIVPLFYLISGYAARLLNTLQSDNFYPHIQMGVVMIGAILAGILLGLISGRISSKANRNAYLIVCGGFTVTLLIVMVLRMIGLH